MKFAGVLLIVLGVVCYCTARGASKGKPQYCGQNQQFSVGVNLPCGCYLKGHPCDIDDDWCKPRCICKSDHCVDKQGNCIPIERAREDYRKIHCPCSKHRV